MTQDNILDMMNGARDRYVLAAIESRKMVPKRSAGSRRILLIAAVLALMTLLAGCVAVYFWMQDLAVGTETYTRYNDDQGKALSEPVEVQRQVMTFAGYTGSNSNKAFSEWYAFQESYDPEGKYITNIPDLPEIENNYEYVYGCYTPEMVEKLDEIVAKYGMKLLDVWIPVQGWQSDVALQQGLGVTTLLKPGAQAEMERVSGMLYPPYNFDLTYGFRLTGENAAWTGRVWATEYYYHKEYLPRDSTWHLDMTSFDQWSYTTADGVELLLAMNKTGGGFIIADRGEAFQVVNVDGNNTGSLYPSPDQVPGKQALEQMAEAFDFGITIAPINAAAMEPAMDAAEAEHQASQIYEDPVYAGFEEWMKDNAFWWAEDYDYTFHDINHDGEEELLIGRSDGFISLWLTLENGQVAWYHVGRFLCEEDVYESSDPWGDHTRAYSWSFFHTPNANPEESSVLGMVQRLSDGTWTLSDDLGIQNAREVTQAEAEAFLAQFKRVELDWKPIRDYPLAGSGTVGNYLDSLNRPVSREELRQMYADFLTEQGDDWYTHYQFMDINGDGTEELLLSDDIEKCMGSYTYRYGEIQSTFFVNSYYCQGDVWETVDIAHEDIQTEIEQHEFFRYVGDEKISVAYVAYNRGTASWQSDLDGTPMAEADAQAILSKYPRIPLNLRPIDELIG